MNTAAQTMSAIAASINDLCPGALGARRVAEVQALLDRVLPEYAAALGLTMDEVLAAMEKGRTMSAPSYYQDATFPKLDGVRVLESPEAFKVAFPSGRFICPACDGHSTDPYECTTGLVRNGKPCDWKAYGLFGTAGKGMRVLVKSTFKDSPRVHEIFMPLEAATATGDKA